MFNRKSRKRMPELELGLESEPEPEPELEPAVLSYPYGWTQCPLCDNGKKIDKPVCVVCVARGLTYDWGFSKKTEILSADELRRLRKPEMPQVVDSGDTITWGCHYAVWGDGFSPAYRCPFRVKYTVKQGATIDMGKVPEAMIIHMANTGHWTEN
jgi:hypothetical protein